MKITTNLKKLAVIGSLTLWSIGGLTATAANATDSASGGPGDEVSAPNAGELQRLIENDPTMRYVSVAEAEEKFGFDPSADAAGSGDASRQVITPMNDWWGCGWDGKADYPHVTSGEASVHGYWVYNSGNCPSTANVTVKLQALGCSNFGCTWITQQTATAVGVTPGSGTGHWATPHKACASANTVGWRGQVGVELKDFWHPYGATDGPAKDLNCTPA